MPTRRPKSAKERSTLRKVTKRATGSRSRPKAADGDDPIDSRSSLQIVGIGTSAGGLEALEQFLKHAPADGGLAYVVVQHLDPTHKGMLPELLGRFTQMKVFEVTNGLRVKRDCVYVIPPNKDLSILHGVLHLLAPVAARGLRSPIDFFFRSLADDQRDHSVGVVLSGMGSDGTLGLRAIKEKAGLILVQDPADARFDGMPRSAIAAGLADIVGAAGDLPAKLIGYRARARPARSAESDLDGSAQGDLEKVIILLRASTGRDFSHYKKRGVYRRIERRMHIHQIDRMAAYVSYLRESPVELDLLFKELLIGVTNFFRDPNVWRQVQDEALPALLQASPHAASLRAWVAGCSTGEEAYSLAITFMEALRQSKHPGRHTLQIFATDLDRDAIERARHATYPANIAADVGPERLSRYFVEENGNFRARNEIREMVTFASHDVLLDAPFTKLDFLACRNLLIYLEPGPQQRLIKLFHYSLRPGGFLFLGSAETVGRQEALFEPVEGRDRLYRRRPGEAAGGEGVDFGGGWLPMARQAREDVKAREAPPDLQSLADRLLLQRFSPAAVLINAKGDIVYVSGRTGKYLELPAGKINWNLYAMAREELRGPLTSTLNQVLRKKIDVTARAITLGTNGGQQTFDLHVHPIAEPAELRGLVMVLFKDVASPAPEGRGAARSAKTAGGRLTEAERALREAQDETVQLREDMQSTQEELKSANEELQSTNEELQSTNEELTTSKEEMQSMNEELQTVNAELQSKVDDLTRTSSDMRNLLDSTDIATVFLDASLRVRRFTSNATQVFKLIPGDTGRPLSDIATDLEYRDLENDAQHVLRTLTSAERLINASDRRRFKVRIMPYRTLDNVIDGVVITCVNITEYLSLLTNDSKERP